MFTTTETSTLLIFGFLLLLATPADATPAGSAKIQLYRWTSQKCPSDQDEKTTFPFSDEKTHFHELKRRLLWSSRQNLYRVCTNGEITDIRLVGDVNAASFELALDECSTQDCLDYRNGFTGVHTGVGFSLALGSAIFSGLQMTTGPVLGGLGAFWSLVGTGSPSLDQIMSEVNRRIKAASTELSWAAIKADIDTAVRQLGLKQDHDSTPYGKNGNPRCRKEEGTSLRDAIEQALTTTKTYVDSIDLEVLALEMVVKTLPLLADLLYAAYTHILGVESRLACKGTYNNFRSGWQRLLFLVNLVETKYKTAKVCPNQGGRLTMRAGKPTNCLVNQWKCYWKEKGFIKVVYCGDDGSHGSKTCDDSYATPCYSSNGVHFRSSTSTNAYDSKWPQIAHVRAAFLDNQALLLDPIKEYIARLQTDVDQLCGYCSVRDSMIEPDRAVPVEIFLLASSQNHCTGSNLPACVSTLKRTYKRPEQPADLENDQLDFCGPTGPDNTLGKELEDTSNNDENNDKNNGGGGGGGDKNKDKDKDKNKDKDKDKNKTKKRVVYVEEQCDDLVAKWGGERQAQTTSFLSHGDRIQPLSIFLLSIACLLWVFE